MTQYPLIPTKTDPGVGVLEGIQQAILGLELSVSGLNGGIAGTSWEGQLTSTGQVIVVDGDLLAVTGRYILFDNVASTYTGEFSLDSATAIYDTGFGVEIALASGDLILNETGANDWTVTLWFVTYPALVVGAGSSIQDELTAIQAAINGLVTANYQSELTAIQTAISGLSLQAGVNGSLSWTGLVFDGPDITVLQSNNVVALSGHCIWYIEGTGSGSGEFSLYSTSTSASFTYFDLELVGNDVVITNISTGMATVNVRLEFFTVPFIGSGIVGSPGVDGADGADGADGVNANYFPWIIYDFSPVSPLALTSGENFLSNTPDLSNHSGLPFTPVTPTDQYVWLGPNETPFYHFPGIWRITWSVKLDNSGVALNRVCPLIVAEDDSSEWGRIIAETEWMWTLIGRQTYITAVAIIRIDDEDKPLHCGARIENTDGVSIVNATLFCELLLDEGSI